MSSPPPASTPPSLHGPDAARRQRLGMWLGALGVACFALTLPTTRLATGDAAAPQMTPAFVTVGRVAVAGLLSAAFLAITRSPWPPRALWGPLALAVLGNVIGFPLLLALAVPHVSAAHAAVVLATLPLATAVLSAWVLGQRARPAFWACAVLGAALVAVFMWRSAPHAGRAGNLLPNLYLLGAVLTCAMGYVAGAKATPVLGAERVICWMCAAMLPVALPLTLWLWPAHPVAPSAWAGFAYAGTVSMWAGFFAWYRGLDWGGALRVSQVQLLQPFLAMLAAWPLLGEAPAGQALLFCLAVIATVYAAKRFSTPTPNRSYPESASANPAAASAVAVLADTARPATHQRGARRLAVQIKPMHLGAGQGANHSDGRRHREDLQRGHAAKGAVLCAAKRRTPR